MVQKSNHLIHTADVLASEVTDGEVRVNLGFQEDVATGGKGVAQSAPVWGVDGFFSVPNDPDKNGACMATYVQDGDERRVLATRDNRFSAQTGDFAPGDRGIVSKGEQRLLLKQDVASVVMYTVNQKVDLSQLVSVNGKDGITLLLNGRSYIQMESESISLVVLGDTGVGSITITPDGVEIVGAKFACNTAGGNLGTVGAGIPPPPGANSILKGPVGVAGTPSAMWTVGT